MGACGGKGAEANIIMDRQTNDKRTATIRSGRANLNRYLPGSVVKMGSEGEVQL